MHTKIEQSMKLDRIKLILEEKSISQTWLSKRLGKSYGMVNTYVIGFNQVWMFYYK